MSLAEEYPKEQERLQELVIAYAGLGPAGSWGLAAIQGVLKRANIAAASQDAVGMIHCFKEMQGCQ